MLLNHQRISYLTNVPINCATAYKGHHVSLPIEEERYGMLAMEEQELKSVPQAKTFKIHRIIAKNMEKFH